jgi:hypothetical protein
MRIPLRLKSGGVGEVDAAASALLEDADVLVLGIENETHLPLLRALMKHGKPTIVVCLASPYLADQLQGASAVLLTYSSQDVSVDAAAEAILGASGTPGRLPVSTSRFPFGSGLDAATAVQPLAPTGLAAASVPLRAAVDPHGE